MQPRNLRAPLAAMLEDMPDIAPARPKSPRFNRASAWAAGGVVGSSLLSTSVASLLAGGSLAGQAAALAVALVLAEPVGRCFRRAIETAHAPDRSPWLPTARHLGKRALSSASFVATAVGFTGIFTTASDLAFDKSPLAAGIALGVTALACASTASIESIATARKTLDTFVSAPPPDLHRFSDPSAPPPKAPRRRP